MPIRRNQAFLNTDEKIAYVSAILKAKEDGWYDWYVRQHAVIAYYAHGGPSFLPWHRYFIRLFEQGLRSINPDLTLPYWDWTVDRTPTSSVWSVGFMGPNGEPGDGKVRAGPFAYDRGRWTCVSAGNDNVPPYLRRQFDTNTPLPTTAQVDDCLAQTPYDSPPWDGRSQPSFRNVLETVIHNRVHTWVGGNMGLLSSPNDPVFFLHHCNTDRLWALWQQWNPDGYLPKSGATRGQNQPDLMYPWDGSGPDGSRVSIDSVLDHWALGYSYDTEYPTAEGDHMGPGDVLRSDTWITSKNGLFACWYHPAGYIGLFQSGGSGPLWWTPYAPGGVFIMRMDGDLVLYDDQGQQAWNSGTSSPGNRLNVTDEGTLEVVDLSGNTVWSNRAAAEMVR